MATEMKYCYKHLTFLGVHPHKPLNKFRVVFDIAAITFVFVLTLFNFYRVKDLRIVESFCSIFLITIKYISLVSWRKDMKKIEDSWERFWAVTAEDAQVVFLQKHLKLVKTFYYYIYMFGILAFTAKPLFMRGSSIFDCYIPSVIPFTLFYILECYLILIGCSVFVALNIYACFLIITVAVQFRLLNLKIREIGSLSVEDRSDLNKLMRDLKSLVDYQQFLMRYVKDLNITLCVPVFLLMAICIFMLCINMYVLSTNQGTLIDKSRIMIISSSIICEYFMVYGLPAQLLMDESALTAEMIYNEFKWYLPNMRTLKNVFLLMILRSQRGVCLRAGNYHVISNQTILLLLKTAYSFYTILQKLIKPGE